MAQMQRFSFGVDSVSLEDSSKNVYGLRDITSASLNMSYEMAEKRGGSRNEVRSVAVHSRNSEVVIETGYADAKLANLFSGGSITSLGTSAASITTAISTLFGTTATIPTALSEGTVAVTPSLVKSDKYYIEALSLTAVSVTRVSDGTIIGSYTLSGSGTIALTGEGIIILAGSTGVASLTVGEKAYFVSRSTINSFNQKLDFDTTFPAEMGVNLTVNFGGMREQVSISRVQATGSIESMSSTEFRLKNVTMKAIFDENLNRIAQMHQTA